MSILIKGVSLKDFKPFCPCLNGEYGYCDIPWVKRCYGIGKDGCPLVEIPPHGRLIDADALRAFAYDRQKETGIACCVDALDISLAPTIIPAEEDEK